MIRMTKLFMVVLVGILLVGYTPHKSYAASTDGGISLLFQQVAIYQGDLIDTPVVRLHYQFTGSCIDSNSGIYITMLNFPLRQTSFINLGTAGSIDLYVNPGWIQWMSYEQRFLEAVIMNANCQSKGRFSFTILPDPIVTPPYCKFGCE